MINSSKIILCRRFKPAVTVSPLPVADPPLFPPHPRTGRVRIAISQGFRADISRAIAKLRLEVPAAIENAFDEHRLRRDDEGNGHAPLESCHRQSGQEIVPLRSPQRKCGEPVAEIDDAADIAVRALLTRMHRDVLMKAVDVPLGQRREDHPHKVTVSCAMRGAP